MLFLPVNAAEKGIYNVQPDSKMLDEYDIILNNVINVFIRNSYLSLQLNQLELEKQVAEYRSLQLQINPHFLFNTLQTISIRAMQLDTAGSFIPPVQNLSDILRYSLVLSRPKFRCGMKSLSAKSTLRFRLSVIRAGFTLSGNMMRCCWTSVSCG